jgi:hypothetical protein
MVEVLIRGAGKECFLPAKINVYFVIWIPLAETGEKLGRHISEHAPLL